MSRVVASVVSAAIDRIAPPELGHQFRLLFASATFANLADGIALAAGPLLVASQTSSPALVAQAVVLQRVPWFLFGLGAGVVADRVDRKRLVVAANLARVLVLASLSATIVAEQINVAVVLVAMFLLGTAESFSDIAADTLFPSVVPHNHLGTANARIQLVFTSLNLLGGPPIGAFLFATAMVAPFGTQIVLMALAAATVARMTVPATERQTNQSPRRELIDGLRWTRNHAPIRILALTILLFNMTWGATNSIMVLYATERLGLNEGGFGLFLAAGAVGGIVGTIIYARLERRFSLGTLMRGVLMIELATHFGFGATTAAAVAFCIAFVAGLVASVWGTLSRTVRQQVVPSEYMGRIGALYMVGVKSGLVIGGLIGGAIGSLFDLVTVFWYAGLGSAFFLAVIWQKLPAIVNATRSAV